MLNFRKEKFRWNLFLTLTQALTNQKNYIHLDDCYDTPWLNLRSKKIRQECRQTTTTSMVFSKHVDMSAYIETLKCFCSCVCLFVTIMYMSVCVDPCVCLFVTMNLCVCLWLWICKFLCDYHCVCLFVTTKVHVCLWLSCTCMFVCDYQCVCLFLCAHSWLNVYVMCGEQW